MAYANVQTPNSTEEAMEDSTPKKKRTRRGKLKSQEIYERAITIVKQEKQLYEVATAFITDRVSFKMRDLLRICRKNYYGIFDQPKDPFTGLEKIWYPLTEINVEAVVKNIDLDQKDINFRAKTPNGYGITDLTRSVTRDKLSRIYFGQKLDAFERQLAIDGTAVWKTYEEDGKLIIRPIDILNIYIDPTSPSIQEAYRFTERTLMFPSEMRLMNGWYNLEDIDFNVPEGVPRSDPYWMNNASRMNSNVKMWDVYETWGKIPKSLITGDKADDNEEVDGHIVVSGIDSPGREKCHLIEINTKKDAEGNALKPYEEAWYTRVPNRWYGRGVAEKLLTLQVYANIVFNVRINRSRISQMGLFKIRKGAGITPQMLQRLPSNGGIVLTSMEDLEQLVVQEVGATSYKDEDVINSLSDRLTNAFEVATGESLPASTPATNAVLQSQAAKSGFAMIRDGVAQFLTRWMDRHALPIIASEITAEEIVRFTDDDDNFKEIVDRVVLWKAQKALDEAYAKGYLPSEQELVQEIENARERITKGDMFVDKVQKVVASQLETEVYINNEEMDISVTVQNLISMMNFAPEYREAIVKQTFDLMGLSAPKMPRKAPGAIPPEALMQMLQGGGGVPPQGAGQSAPASGGLPGTEGLLPASAMRGSSGSRMQQIATQAATAGTPPLV